jgi:branched-chain amino acid transport system ATP-binding protein
VRLRRAYPVVALGLLAATAGFAPYALVALASDIGPTVGSGSRQLATLALAQSLAVALAVLALLALVRRRPRRAAVAIAAAAAAALAAGALGTATDTWGIVALLALNATGIAAALVLHPPLLADSYAPGARVRAFAAHRALQALGAAAAAAIVAVLVTDAGLTWRAAFLVLAAVAVAVLPLALGLRDPGRRGPEPGSVPDGTLPLSFGEIAQGLMRVPTVRRLLAAHGALGVLVVPLALFALYFLEDVWGLRTGARGAVYAAVAVVVALLLALLAAEGERLLAAGPERLLRPAAGALAVAAAALIGAVAAPLFGLAVALLCAALACIALGQTAMTAALMTVVRPEVRVHAAALAALATAGVGGTMGVLFTAGVIEDLGTAAALGELALPGIAAAIAVRAAADTAAADLAATVSHLAEEEEAQRARATGATAPLLACHAIAVSYGHRRAVDGVDLAIEQGEIVALVGTNGAGKSTLLRVLSGLTAPDAGSVRLEGREITLLDPERRRRLGIGHVAAGAALFDSLRVFESLRLAAHGAGIAGAEAEQATGWALERFPALASRRGSRVAALSGGERQMLALAQALLSPPRVLLVDELSLGLAAGVARDLLTVVREVHERGTTVLLVEQSIDRALELATRAVFMERGRVRFDGAPADLRRRGDLLRPVFLAAAAHGRPAPAGGAA